MAKLIQYASQVILGCFIGCEAQIDPSVTFVHNGLGVVIHDSVSIASGSSICQQVTLGVVNPLQGGEDPKLERTFLLELAQRYLAA